jgi:hypothetical protein
MKRTLIRYKTKPERVQENEHLIGKVFQELREKSSQGIRYLALKLSDGTFVHFVCGRRRHSRLRPGGFSLVPEWDHRALRRAAAGRGGHRGRQLSNARRLATLKAAVAGIRLSGAKRPRCKQR